MNLPLEIILKVYCYLDIGDILKISSLNTILYSAKTKLKLRKWFRPYFKMFLNKKFMKYLNRNHYVLSGFTLTKILKGTFDQNIHKVLHFYSNYGYLDSLLCCILRCHGYVHQNCVWIRYVDKKVNISSFHKKECIVHSYFRRKTDTTVRITVVPQGEFIGKGSKFLNSESIFDGKTFFYNKKSFE